MKFVEKISVDELKRMMLDVLRTSLQHFALLGDRPESGELVKREPARLVRGLSDEEWAAELRLLCQRIQKDYPLQAFRFAGFGRLLQQVLDLTDVEEGVEVWSRVFDFKRDLAIPRGGSEKIPGPASPPIGGESSGPFQLIRDGDLFLQPGQARPELDPSLRRAITRQVANHFFLANVMQRLRDLRRTKEVATPLDTLALQMAYELLDRGAPIPRDYQPIGMSGFRRYQTSLSLADPGEGHLYVTVQKSSLLAGTIVHVEHIDRDKVADKDKLEPYRLPAIRHVARVRLHVGSETPVTAFIGRPVFENQSFRMDLLKTAHMTGSACSSRFDFGVADCKIGMERMTASEAVEFMQAVRGNVVRDASRQTLSAAFNINTPIVDDRPDAPRPGLVSDPFELALLGIELTEAGGFEKVTWDGASNQVPSLPILGQLSFAQLLELIHRAHSKGLETYISAGMVSEHMRDATFLGVGGVGIGTSMHYIDPQTKLMGQLHPAAIEAALAARDQAAAAVRGQAARWLAWLDRLYFEGMLAEELVTPREKLFGAMRVADESAITLILTELRGRSGDHHGIPTPDEILEGSHEVARASDVIKAARASRNTMFWSRLQDDELEEYLKDVHRRLLADDEPNLQQLLS